MLIVDTYFLDIGDTDYSDHPGSSHFERFSCSTRDSDVTKSKEKSVEEAEKVRSLFFLTAFKSKLLRDAVDDTYCYTFSLLN